MKEHQGGVVSLPIEDIIGQVDGVDAAGGGHTTQLRNHYSEVKPKTL